MKNILFIVVVLIVVVILYVHSTNQEITSVASGGTDLQLFPSHTHVRGDHNTNPFWVVPPVTPIDPIHMVMDIPKVVFNSGITVTDLTPSPDVAPTTPVIVMNIPKPINIPGLTILQPLLNYTNG